ncbi:nucleotidyltransferase domain-containing protein [Caldivirga sp.]|uniref:nucleotidyltransferase domain-containing protein n=1 Tax=Caldivirga sp. TaxID=2080243 RepID=UPI0025BDBC5F|nr:nucleotidyltransferase domain-containing protein [Caldivirga sp.]
MAEDLIRKMIIKVSKYDEDFRNFISRLIKKYPDSTIVLFGSRARGDNRPSSDFDVLVIIKGKVTWSIVEEISFIADELPVDLIVKSVEDFLNDAGIKLMLRNGCRVLYDGLSLNPC